MTLIIVIVHVELVGHLQCCTCVSCIAPYCMFQSEARSRGLWNLFLPLESDPDTRYGAGLSNLEYAHLAEIMGQSIFASEVSHKNSHFYNISKRVLHPISV